MAFVPLEYFRQHQLRIELQFSSFKFNKAFFKTPIDAKFSVSFISFNTFNIHFKKIFLWPPGENFFNNQALSAWEVC
jgi:hypothetical protein